MTLSIRVNFLSSVFLRLSIFWSLTSTAGGDGLTTGGLTFGGFGVTAFGGGFGGLTTGGFDIGFETGGG